MKKVYEFIGNKFIVMIEEVELFGFKGIVDIIIIVFCIGNIVVKLVNGIIDLLVLMVVKGYFCNDKLLVILILMNDVLSFNFKNIGIFFNFKNIYFVFFG